MSTNIHRLLSIFSPNTVNTRRNQHHNYVTTDNEYNSLPLESPFGDLPIDGLFRPRHVSGLEMVGLDKRSHSGAIPFRDGVDYPKTVVKNKLNVNKNMYMKNKNKWARY